MTRQELATKDAQLSSEIDTIAGKIAALSPKAANGHDDGPAAWEEIKQLAAQRAELALRREVLRNAKQSPEFREASKAELLVRQLDANFARKLPQHKGDLIGELQDEYRTLQNRDNLYVRQFDLADLETHLPRAISARLTGEAYARNQVKSIEDTNARTQGDPAFRHANRTRLEDEWRLKLEVFSRHTLELLAATKLPAIPNALLAKFEEQ
jgi:hypothetical protein